MKIEIEKLVKLLVDRENKGMRFIGVQSHRKLKLLAKNRQTKQPTNEAMGFTEVVKHSNYIGMLGKSYRNAKARDEDINPNDVEIGERKDKAKRIGQSSVLIGEDKTYRLELGPHKAQPAVYMAAGKAFTKDQLKDYLPASELKNKPPMVFSIRLENVDRLAVDGEEYQPTK